MSITDLSQATVQHTSNGLRIHPESFVKKLPTLSYQQGLLAIEEVSTQQLVQQYGTPLYVYSKKAVLDAYQAYTDSFAEIDHQICYAVKANSNLAVLKVLAEAGAGFDLVSSGELARVLAAGADPSKIVFSGVGKTVAEMKAALQAGIGCFNVESLSELDTLNAVAAELQVKAPISIRVNPDVDAKTHPYISTGLKDNKFGISHDVAIKAYKHADSLEHLDIVGIDCHIGSQLTEIDPFVAALDKVCELIESLKQEGIELEHVDLGGGLGVIYIDEEVAEVSEFANALLPKLKQLGLKVFFEPGRSIVANAGVLLTKVEVLKPTEHKNFAIVDAAMNDLIRPALYQAEMAVIPMSSESQEGSEEQSWDIVGAVCETGDFLAKKRLLSLAVGDILAITGAGAYGFVMSSNYNSRPRPAEIMVSGDKHQVVRKRETVEQLFEGESFFELD
ncbi:MAG TPA: diaminopimelate decarboxylase [Psychrobacter sp.]|uniref:Diaminopimelate decarboxylase n=1 Tax=Psychrobacter pasteurii TaxID=1945520 RepID=A0A1R4EF29_9GAMM|nr:diaminopimelate decarboxylase [Psychrobacter pasteurii]SJM37088.1 Diaminopimelate decarboxylase [Psychrobacter pasteurii]HAO60343.1 diaminopimelate decarboxylase [Psychrobacter sp.]